MKIKLLKKIIFAIIILSAIIVFYYFDFKQYLSFEYLKNSREKFLSLYNENFMMIIGWYLVIYITTAALALPGALVLTLAGGAIFGFGTGALLVSFASSIGATISCFISRYFLRGFFEKKFANRLETINRGIEKDGSFYLFSIRLFPAFPFFLTNILMGLTKISLLKFYIVSQIGMLPPTLVFVNAGKEIGKINSIEEILSPGFLISFALLGIFPFAVKKILVVYEKKIRMKNISKANLL